MFYKTRNPKNSRWSPASECFTSRTTFRTGFEKRCNSPSGFWEPIGFVEYFEITCVVVETVERDMDVEHHFHVSQSTIHLPCFSTFLNQLAMSMLAHTCKNLIHAWMCHTTEHMCSNKLGDDAPGSGDALATPLLSCSVSWFLVMLSSMHTVSVYFCSIFLILQSLDKPHSQFISHQHFPKVKQLQSSNPKSSKYNHT